MKSARPFFLGAAILGLLFGGVSGVSNAGGQAGGDSSQEAEKYSAEAVKATQQHDLAGAELAWRKVVTLDPSSAQAHHNLGMIYYLQHKYLRAEEALQQALQLDPSLANARVLLGASLQREGKPDRAIGELDRAMKLRLSEAAERTARIALHGAWTAKGNYTKALEALKPLQGRDPQDLDVLYSLGETYLQLAMKSFGQIAVAAPDSYRVHQIEAESLAREGVNRYREAIHEYNLALQQKPDLLGAHYKIGLLTMVADRTPSGQSEAQRQFEAELQLNPYDAWSEYRLGQIYMNRPDAVNAFVHFRRALELDDSFVPPRLSLALLLERQGKPEEAEKLLETAEKLDPNLDAVHYHLARLYRHSGNTAMAEDELRQFQKIQSGRLGFERQLEEALQGVTESAGDLDSTER